MLFGIGTAELRASSYVEYRSSALNDGMASFSFCLVMRSAVLLAALLVAQRAAQLGCTGGFLLAGQAGCTSQLLSGLIQATQFPLFLSYISFSRLPLGATSSGGPCSVFSIKSLRATIQMTSG